MKQIEIIADDPERLIIVQGMGDVSAKVSDEEYAKIMTMQKTCDELQEKLDKLWDEGGE